MTLHLPAEANPDVGGSQCNSSYATPEVMDSSQFLVSEGSAVTSIRVVYVLAKS